MQPRHAYKEVEFQQKKQYTRTPTRQRFTESAGGSFSFGYNTQTAGFSKTAGSSAGF